MQLLIQTPAKVLNKAYLKQNVQQDKILSFQKHIDSLFERLNPNESEENQKNLVRDFLNHSHFKDRFEINTAGREDLAIHRGKTSKDSVGVIIENKRIDSPEMMSHTRPNVKALHELILYYFVEREVKKNIEISHLIATDLHNWYIFDENDFRKIFYENKAFKKIYQTKTEQNKDNGFFYSEVKKLLETLTDLELPCAYFSFDKTKRSDAAQIALYKLLSPEHLLKLPFENDANSLNREFYNELLYIIGLEEVKDGGKKIIQRKTPQNRLEGSLLENAINEIEVDNALFNLDNLNSYGQNQEEQLFNVGLELCITWLNRILFLKLLEGQLIKYRRGDRAYAFLNENRVKDFDELSELFFEVLAVPTSQRKPSVTERYGNIPYLNSSLFELTELERKALKIKDLKGRLGMPIYAQSVLKGDKGKRKQGEMSTVKYLFEFLDAYDFASDSSAQIQEQAKTIINASVLGLIFEKINGYRDGSFFTPGFITMYMCRETLRKAVMEKFNSSPLAPRGGISTFDNILEHIDYKDKDKRKQYNDIVNSVRICDPAVGSGHFLVSALNELIAIKHDLKILSYRDGSRVRDYQITIENDELIILDEENDQLFEYRLNAANKPIEHLQKLQETLFHEKETIIENCLFGVDINPNSVKICRLRLWIELLKNAYYQAPQPPEGELKTDSKSRVLTPPLGVGATDASGLLLVTLPNIDINIKTGNSLVARFGLEEDLSEVFRKQKFSVKDYKQAVYDYKNSPTKERKAEVLRFIDDIKKEFVQTVYKRDSRRKQINNLRGQLIMLNTQNVDIFGNKIKEDAEIETIRLEKLIAQRETELENAINSPIYRNAFEWRFEFPEVLDEEGKFVGFDAVVGNPPWGAELSKDLKINLKENFPEIDSSNPNSFSYFIGLSRRLSMNQVTQVLPDSILVKDFGKTRKIISGNIFSIAWYQNTAIPDSVRPFKDVEHDVCVISFDKLAHSESTIFKYFYKNGEVNTSSVSVKKSDFIFPELDSLFNLELSKSDIELKKKLSGMSLLGDMMQCHEGIHTGNIREKLFIKNDLDGNAKPLFIGARNGDIINSYYSQMSGWFVDYRKNIIDKSKNEYASLRDENIFKLPKIYITRTGNPIKSFIDESNYASNNFFSLQFKNLSSNTIEKLCFILCIINSKITNYLIRNIIAPSLGNTFVETKIVHLLKLPIPVISETEQQPIINLVEKILSLKKENPQADTQVFEDEIDELVFGLYGLSAEERAVVLGG